MPPTKKSNAGAAPAKPKQVVHYTADYIINPVHPVTVNVIGCGGTGSQVLNSLARMNSALKALGHPGLYVRAIDPDRVSAANMGRQLFSPADLNTHKCVALMSKINRFFGTDWEAVPVTYSPAAEIPVANITISCVDSGAARKSIRQTLAGAPVPKDGSAAGYHRTAGRVEPYNVPYYWMDFGNMMDRGQVVIGTLQKIKQPAGSEYNCKEVLPTVDDLHPEILVDGKDDDQGPSCSLAEALQKQDLFINTNLANMGLGLLWKMFREVRLRFHGLYLNLDTMSVNPIKI